MTGGSVAQCITPDTVDVRGRVSSAGAKVAPSNGIKWTVTSGSTGVYTITFSEQYAQYLGTQITLESASGTYYTAFNATTKVLTVSTFAVDGSTATAKAFSFTASFSESKAP